MRAVYRLRQGLANLRAAVRPEDWDLVDRYLSPAERALFERLQTADQRHSVQVLRSLLAEGIADDSLLRAALLHDVGKSHCRIGVWNRTVAVLARALFGGLPQFLLRQREGNWWLPYFVIENHPEIGASMLAQAGSEERVWRVVELHQFEPNQVRGLRDDSWLRQALTALRRADEEN